MCVKKKTCAVILFCATTFEFNYYFCHFYFILDATYLFVFIKAIETDSDTQTTARMTTTWPLQCITMGTEWWWQVIPAFGGSKLKTTTECSGSIHYSPLLLITCFLIPTYIPTLWGEEVWNAFHLCVCLRFIFTLHVTCLVNSAAHMWGTKPYDKHIEPVETKIVSVLAAGEGFHNYHHCFPWDYKTAELGGYSFNFTKLLIDLMAKIGWAYDLKTVPEEMIKRRVQRTGDGTHPVWGWDDPELTVKDIEGTIIS